MVDQINHWFKPTIANRPSACIHLMCSSIGQTMSVHTTFAQQWWNGFGDLCYGTQELHAFLASPNHLKQVSVALVKPIINTRESEAIKNAMSVFPRRNKYSIQKGNNILTNYRVQIVIAMEWAKTLRPKISKLSFKLILRNGLSSTSVHNDLFQPNADSGNIWGS